uniref:Uncharacterized protein n=1 Tax=Anguilla anguilla TaxID=7936 RepID=A0A0E9W6J0_ANGAN
MNSWATSLPVRTFCQQNLYNIHARFVSQLRYYESVLADIYYSTVIRLRKQRP